MNDDVFVDTNIYVYAAVKSDDIKHTEIIDRTNVTIITVDTVKHCLILKERYNYSYWDSLLLATALENSCKIIYSEDMQDGQIIEHDLLIKNPFGENCLI